MKKELSPEQSLAPRTMDEAFKFADLMSKSSMVPKEFQGNPGNIIVAIQWGMEIGLQPMQAMQNIAVINGRPCLWGDSVIALVKSSPACEYIREEQSDTAATCRVKRKGEDEQVRTFSAYDAKTAGLLGKAGPWTQYPKRMMQMRARSWALRDVFPDVLRGMAVAEEVMDTTPIEREVNPDAPAARIKSGDDYAEYEAEHIQSLHDAAEDGKDCLKAAFTLLPVCQHKQTLWATHGAALKAAAQKVDESRVVETHE